MYIKNLIFVAMCCLLFACSKPLPAAKIINLDATVPKRFHLQELRMITSSIDPKEQTMSILYGNVKAFNRVREAGSITKNEELVLVTWLQKADETWFGAKIPGKLRSVEQLRTGNNPLKPAYQYFSGKTMELRKDTLGNYRRIIHIFDQKPSILP